jgi:hypothetical protein
MQVERQCEAWDWIQLGMRCEVYGLVINSTTNNIWGFETYFSYKIVVSLRMNSTGNEVWLNSITGLVNTSYSKDSLQTGEQCDYVIPLCFRRKPEDKTSFW